MPGLEYCDNCTAPVKKRAAAPAATGKSGDPLRADTTADLELDLAVPEVRSPEPSRRIGVADISSPGAIRAGGAGVRGAALYDLEVQRIAGYGKPPDGLLAAIPYALHVLSRRGVLKREAEQAKQLRRSADASARRALIDLGRALYERRDAIDLGEISSRVEAVRRATGEVVVNQRDPRATRKEIDEKRAELEARAREANADLAPWRDKETRLNTQLNIKKGELDRVNARLKRIEIEIRNVTARVRQAGGTADEAQLAALEADAEARRAEAAVAEGPVRELLEELATVRREVAARAAVTATIDQERRSMEELAREVDGELSRTAAHATAEAEEAFLALGEEGHVRGLDETLPSHAAKVEAALGQLEDRRRREELHMKAIDAWDRPAMKKGAIVIGAAGALILAMLVLAIVR